MWLPKIQAVLVVCGIGLQKLGVHNWGVVSSFMWYIISVVVPVAGFSRVSLYLKVLGASIRVCVS